MYDRNTPYQGGRRVDSVRRWKIWRYFKDYFPVTLKKTVDLDPSRNYIFCYHPHGIMAVGSFCNFCTESTDFSKIFPGIRPYALTLDGHFQFPFYREFFMCSGSCAVSKRSIEWILTKEGKGCAPVIVIGGAAEALDAHAFQATLTLKRRKGFIRLAIKHGVSLVPIYSFGENELFSQVLNPKGSLLRKTQEKLMRILGFSPPLYHGRGIFQYTFGILPNRNPIVTVVGRPLDVEKIANPTEEEVNKVHERYVKSLNELFEENKKSYGYDNVDLVID
ncbi:2-acylglycerol O-acyltransferase 1 [Nymphon striatum]|nr:2-acylglycerol O-acyltransferase 1 [Nymphon striatum]